MATAKPKKATNPAAKPVKPAAKKPAAKKVAIPQGVQLNPYLVFGGNCEAAFKFYQKAFGGELGDVYRFKDIPASEGVKFDAKSRNKIMHIGLMVGANCLMGCDAMPGQAVKFGDQVALSICASNAAEAKRIFKALSARGKVTVPLAKAFWAELFGQATDRFGITWMVNFMGDACAK